MVLVTDPDQTTPTPNEGDNFTIMNTGNSADTGSELFSVYTDEAGDIIVGTSIANGGIDINMATRGWTDRRGRDD